MMILWPIDSWEISLNIEFCITLFQKKIATWIGMTVKIFIFSLVIFDISDLENTWSTDWQKHTLSPIIIEIKIIIGRALFYIS